MKKLILLITLLLISLTFFACPPEPLEDLNTTYVAGYYEDSSGNKVACYWEDGTKTDLHTAADSDANSIWVVSP